MSLYGVQVAGSQNDSRAKREEELKSTVIFGVFCSSGLALSHSRLQPRGDILSPGA